MSLVFGDDRLDLRQVPNLVSQRIGILARKLLTATSAGVRLERLDLIARPGWDECPLVFPMAALAAPLSLAFGRLLPRRFGVRMLGARRQ